MPASTDLQTAPAAPETVPLGVSDPGICSAAPSGAPAAQVLVLGLGNDILTDDAVGLRVADELRNRFAADPRVEVQSTTEMGLALLDFISGYRSVVIVDAIQTGQAEPGTSRIFSSQDLGQSIGRTPHFLGVTDTLTLGRLLGLPMPDRVRICSVEVADPYTLGTQLTPAVAQAVPRLVDALHREVSAFLGQPSPPAD